MESVAKSVKKRSQASQASKYKHTLQKLKPKEIKHLVQRGSGISISSSVESCNILIETSREGSPFRKNKYTGDSESDGATKSSVYESTRSSLHLSNNRCSNISKCISPCRINSYDESVCSSPRVSDVYIRRSISSSNLVHSTNTTEPSTNTLTDRKKDNLSSRKFSGVEQFSEQKIQSVQNLAEASTTTNEEVKQIETKTLFQAGLTISEESQDRTTQTVAKSFLESLQEKKLNHIEPKHRRLEQTRHTSQERKLINDLELENTLNVQRSHYKSSNNVKSETPIICQCNSQKLDECVCHVKPVSNQKVCLCGNRDCSCNIPAPSKSNYYKFSYLYGPKHTSEQSARELNLSCACGGTLTSTCSCKKSEHVTNGASSTTNKNILANKDKAIKQNNNSLNKSDPAKESGIACSCDVNVDKCICDSSEKPKPFAEQSVKSRTEEFIKYFNRSAYRNSAEDNTCQISVKTRIKSFNNTSTNNKQESLESKSDSNASKLISICNPNSKENIHDPSLYDTEAINRCTCKNKYCVCSASKGQTKELISIYSLDQSRNRAIAEIIPYDDINRNNHMRDSAETSNKKSESVEVKKENNRPVLTTQENVNSPPFSCCNQQNKYSVRPIDVISTVVSTVPKCRNHSPVLLDVEIFPTMEHPNGMKPNQHKVVVKSYGPTHDKCCENKSIGDIHSRSPQHATDAERRQYRKCYGEEPDDWDTYFESAHPRDPRNRHMPPVTVHPGYLPPRMNPQSCACGCSCCNTKKRYENAGHKMQQSSSQTTPSLYESRRASPINCSCCKCRIASPKRFNYHAAHMDRSTNTSQNNLYRVKHTSRSESNAICGHSCSCSKYSSQRYEDRNNDSPRCNNTRSEYDRPNLPHNCSCDHCIRMGGNAMRNNRDFEKLPYEKHRKYGDLVNELQHELGTRKLSIYEQKLSEMENQRAKCRMNDSHNSWSNKDELCRSECTLYQQEHFKEKRPDDRKCCNSAEHDRHIIERGRVEKNISKFNSNQDCWTMSK